MRQTVVGIFDQYAAARHASELLRQRGIDESDIHVTESTEGTGTREAAAQEPSLFERIRKFFSDDVDDDFEVSAYSEHVRRGGAVVKVDVDDESKVDAAHDALVAAGAVDIDERVNEWRSSGWSAPERPARDTARAASSEAVSSTEGKSVIPVVKEDLQVGKRTVRAGGVRVYTRLVEDKVHESVDLREERATVERRAVDRPATAEDLRAAGERSIEIEERVERPVVEKTARVVEEVVVGKDVRQKTVDIDDTVRRTEVSIENTGGDAQKSYARFDTDFRDDFRTRFAHAGREYKDYEPAYRYGYALAGDSRYHGKDWDSFESEARADWSRANPDSPWEEFKAAVRHAWECATR